MPFQIRVTEKLLRKIVIFTLSFMVCWGFVLVLAQIKPFWVDEWRVIYNLKYKTPLVLFGPLDYMQQFPRVYLILIKLFSAPFDYSYFTLRLPSFLVGTLTIFFSFRLMKKIFPGTDMNRFLFVMILVSSYTFTEYFVQIKQYTMDILLSLVAMAQLIELLNLNGSRRRYILLCASLFVAPFFSYTFPIAVAPVFLVVLVQDIMLVKSGAGAAAKRKILLQWFALGLCAVAIVFFYFLDISQVMHDKGMHQFWGSIMMTDGFNWNTFYTSCYWLFAEVGRGLIFSIIFGVLGIISFAYAIYKCAARLMKSETVGIDFIRLYSVALLGIVLILFIIGKFPVGEPRLNAFTVPAISILIISFLGYLKANAATARSARNLSLLLYLGVIGNIYTTFYAGISGPVYARKLDIYVATENAIILAQAKKIPIFITPEVAYPYDKTQNLPFTNTVPGDWVLKTFPAYKVQENIPVVAICALSDLNAYLQMLPPSVTAVMVGNGTSYHVINR